MVLGFPNPAVGHWGPFLEPSMRVGHDANREEEPKGSGAFLWWVAAEELGRWWSHPWLRKLARGMWNDTTSDKKRKMDGW